MSPTPRPRAHKGAGDQPASKGFHSGFPPAAAVGNGSHSGFPPAVDRAYSAAQTGAPGIQPAAGQAVGGNYGALTSAAAIPRVSKQQWPLHCATDRWPIARICADVDSDGTNANCADVDSDGATAGSVSNGDVGSVGGGCTDGAGADCRACPAES